MRPKVAHLLDILHSGIDAVRPARLFPRLFSNPPEVLRSWQNAPERFLLCLGKASIHSATAILGQTACIDHFILSPYDGPDELNIHVGSHPIPDQKSFDSTQELLAWLAGLPAGSNLSVVLSGGTSALLVLPVEGVSLESKMAINEMLIRSGASIREINTVRKHLSAVKGGQLQRHVSQLNTLVLIISDVIGDDFASIGSGPFYPDPSTFLEARGVLERYNLWNQAPADVRLVLERGIEGQLPETPKNGTSTIPHLMIASNEIACKAAADRARNLGYTIDIWTNAVSGKLQDFALKFADSIRAAKSNTAVIAGGEITIEVKGSGTGGRNEHLALLMTEQIAGTNVVFGAAGTDGIDGNSPAAGAWCDGQTFARASGQESFRQATNTYDSYNYFKKIGQTIETGPTGTNVMDLYVALT